MKKVWALLLTVVMVCMLTVPAWAAKKTKLSPEDTIKIEVVELGIESVDGCVADLEVTPWENKAALETLKNETGHDAVAEMDSAWADVVAHQSDVKGLCKDLPDEDLEVAKMFYVSFYCDHGHDLKDHHHYASLTLSAGQAGSLVSLLRYNAATGTWEIVPFDRVGANSIRFMLTEPSPYAMIVKDNSGHGRTSPQTGEASPALALCGAMLFAGGAVVLTGKSKKRG